MLKPRLLLVLVAFFRSTSAPASAPATIPRLTSAPALAVPYKRSGSGEAAPKV